MINQVPVCVPSTLPYLGAIIPGPKPTPPSPRRIHCRQKPSATDHTCRDHRRPKEDSTPTQSGRRRSWRCSRPGSTSQGSLRTTRSSRTRYPCSNESPQGSPSPCPHGRWYTTKQCCWPCNLHMTLHCKPRLRAARDGMGRVQDCTTCSARGPGACATQTTRRTAPPHVQVPKSPLHPSATVPHADWEVYRSKAQL